MLKDAILEEIKPRAAGLQATGLRAGRFAQADLIIGRFCRAGSAGRYSQVEVDYGAGRFCAGRFSESEIASVQ